MNSDGYAVSNQSRSSKCTSQYNHRERKFSSVISVSNQSMSGKLQSPVDRVMNL